ncbi:hypothetical protein SLS61_005209 [Didymella pomorum]
MPAITEEKAYVARRATDELSCWDNHSDGKTFTAKNGDWEIVCGKDYAGGDMGASSPGSFEECIKDCDSTPGCIDVSFAWPNSCYKKNKLTIALDNNSIWTARKKVTPSTGGSGTDTKTPSVTKAVTCEGKADDGVKYKSKKGTFLIDGGDIGSSSTDSFAACIEDCAATDGCVDISYVWGACYKKGTVNEGGIAGHVWSAKLVASDPDPSATSTTSTATATAEATAAPITCPSSNGKTPTIASGGTYEIACGTDYGGGDFKAVEAATFDLCLKACDDNDACQALAYVAPTCYLKNEVNKANSVAHVWGAVVKKAAKDAFAFPTIPDKALESGATESMMAEVLTLPPMPTATLGPVSPPGIDMGGLGVLTPEPKTELWFGGSAAEMKDEESGAVTVRISVDYKYPSIVLDHSIYIKNVDCSSGSLQGKFENQLAFTHAADSWPAKAPLLLITSAKSCGNGDQNSFWLAQSISFDMGASTFSAPGSAVELADIYNEMDIDFGKIEINNSTSNSSMGTDGDDLSCGKPDSPFVDGLPAVACGMSFDKSLDDNLGYYAANGDDEQHVLASAGADTSNSTELSVNVRRGFNKRWSFKSVFKAVAKAAVSVVKQAVVVVAKQVAATVVSVAKTAAKVAVAVVKTTVKVGIAVATNWVKLAKFVVTGNYDNSLTLPIDLTGTGLTKTTPWEGTTGFKFYDYKPDREGAKWKKSKINLERVATELLKAPGEADPEPGIELWCVDCGVKGKFVAKGSLSATPLSGLKKAQVGVHGNMYVGAFLGVNAFTKYEKTIKKELMKRNLAGWEIPKIVSLGPAISLSTQATFSIEAEGQLLAGASLNWPAFEATLDFVDTRKSTQSGWTPQVTKKFDAHGELTATAALGLPVTLSFGIDILSGKIKKEIELSDIPALTAEAKLEFDLGTSKTQFGSDDCQGIEWDIALTNELRIDLPGTEGWKLNGWKSPPLAKGCIGRKRIPSDDETSSTTSTISMTSTTSTPTPTPTPTGLQCPDANGKTYTDAGAQKKQYTVTCNKDAAGADITWAMRPSMESCMEWCGTVSSCVGIVFAPKRTDQNCWLKSGYPALIANPSPNTDPIHSSMTTQPTLTILSMYYADRDITPYAKQNVARGSQLVIDTNNIVGWANGDPWPGNQKSISMLFSYGNELRTFVCIGGTGTYVLNPGPASSQPNVQVVPGYESMSGVSNINIVAIAYGPRAITDRAVFQDMYNAIRNAGGRWQYTNANFRIDTWPGIGKTGIVWYKNLDGNYLVSNPARENNYNFFYNARWSKRQEQEGNMIDATPVKEGENSQPTIVGASPAQNTPDAEITPSVTPTASADTSASADTASETPSATPATSTASETSSKTSTTPSATSSDFPQLTVSNSTMNGTSNATDVDFVNFDIVDTTNSLKLNPSLNGNIFLSLVGDTTDLSNLTSGSFTGDSASKTIFGDSSDRLLHYYPDVLASTGASRLRLASWDKIPKGAKLVTLSQLEVEGETMMLGIDTKGNYLWPFVCGIKGQLNKIFLVNDPVNGGVALQKESMKFTVTGGEAYSCEPVALMIKV